MPTTTHFFIFLWLSFLIAFTPGPSIFFAVSQSVRAGFAATLPSLLGNLTASIGYGLLAAGGAGLFLKSNPQLLTVIAAAGAMYLIITGLMIIFRSKTFTFTVASKNLKTYSFAGNFLDGLIVSIANPKIILFYLIVIPQFTSSTESAVSTLIMLGLIQNAMKASSLLFYSCMACQVRGWFNTKMFTAGILQKFSGLIIIIAGVVLIVDNLPFNH